MKMWTYGTDGLSWGFQLWQDKEGEWRFYVDLGHFHFWIGKGD